MKAPSARSRFGYRFVMLARGWRRALDVRLAAVGLTDATWAPLMHLRRSGDGVSQKDLATSVGLDGSSLVRLLDILADKGLVERRSDAADRRTKLVFLTDAGRAAVADIQHVLSDVEAEMLDGLSDAEVAAMLDAFDRIERPIQRILAEREPQR